MRTSSKGSSATRSNCRLTCRLAKGSGDLACYRTYGDHHIDRGLIIILLRMFNLNATVASSRWAPAKLWMPSYRLGFRATTQYYLHQGLAIIVPDLACSRLGERWRLSRLYLAESGPPRRLTTSFLTNALSIVPTSLTLKCSEARSSLDASRRWLRDQHIFESISQ